MKETVGTKVIKWFYGIHGPLDEYRRNEINRIGNNIAMTLIMVNLVLVFIAGLVALSTNDYGLTLGIMVWTLLISVFTACGYICYETKHHHLAEVDVEAKQAAPAKKKVLQRAVGYGIYFGIMMYGLQVLTDWLPDRGVLMPLLTHSWTIMIAILDGIFFGSFMGLYELHQIKVDSENQRPQSTSHQGVWLIILIILSISGLLLIRN